MRLYTRQEVMATDALLEELLNVLLRIMEENTETIMPGFTHLQKAQPITLAHHMGAYFEMFKRDRQLMGHSSLWMFPIYGSAAFLAPLMRRLQKNCIWKRGLIYMLCIYLGEYISGRLLKNKDMCPWDYSDCPLQYQGVIRFDFAPLWFLTGLLFERVILRKPV